MISARRGRRRLRPYTPDVTRSQPPNPFIKSDCVVWYEKSAVAEKGGFVRLGILVHEAVLDMIPVIEGLNRRLGAVGWQWESLPQSLHNERGEIG